jgi:hypothetical protein
MKHFDGCENNCVAIANNNLAAFHCEMAKKLPSGSAKNEELHITESYRKEAVRISTKTNGPSHPTTMEYVRKLYTNPNNLI